MERIEQPQNARSRRTRTALLDAAWRVAREEGAEAITMERLAAETDMSRRGVYLHFASRLDVFVGLFEHIDEALDLAASIAPAMAATTPGATLDAWARHVAGYHHALLPVARGVDKARRTDPEAAALWDTAMGAWRGACEMVVGRLVGAGQLAPPWDAATATDLLWALMGVELLEDLVEDAGWGEDAYAERLALLARRTLLVDRDAA